jgi:hypothetical protein
MNNQRERNNMSNNPFKNIKKSEELKEIKDTTARPLLNTDLYKSTIKLAYVVQSTSSQAAAIALVQDVGNKDSMVEITDRIWITNKDGESFTTDTDGNPKGTYGYNTITSILKLLFGEEAELADLVEQGEEKVIKQYNYDSKKEEDTSVIAYPALHGATLAVLVSKDLTCSYKDSSKTYEENSVAKYVKSVDDPRTWTEVKDAMQDSTYTNKWLEANKGKVIDKTSKAGSSTSNTGTPAKALGSGSTPVKKSLFSKS